MLSRAALFVFFLGLCAPVQAQGLNPHDEGARLISALALSEAQRNSVRDFLVVEIARGVAPRAAVERWLQIQAGRGMTIRCRPSTSECLASH